MNGTRHLSLREAIAEGRLDDFVAQEEARGVGTVDRGDLDDALRRVIRPPRSERQTSRSASAGGSTGK